MVELSRSLLHMPLTMYVNVRISTLNRSDSVYVCVQLCVLLCIVYCVCVYSTTMYIFLLVRLGDASSYCFCLDQNRSSARCKRNNQVLILWRWVELVRALRKIYIFVFNSVTRSRERERGREWKKIMKN